MSRDYTDRNTHHTLLDRKQRNGSDDLFTPKLAVEILKPYIDPKWKIWEPAAPSDGRNSIMVDELGAVQTMEDFFEYEHPDYDVQVTNPPYSVKDKWIKRCFELDKPFALLIPTTSLEGVRRVSMWKDKDIQLIIPNRRFHFRLPDEEVVKETGGWYHTSWFTHKFNLPQQINFVEI